MPDALDATTTYEYLLTVSAENAEDAAAEVSVTVLNKGALALVCADPGSVYEGSEDFALDCAASGAPGGSGYTYVWTDRGATANTDLLISRRGRSRPDIRRAGGSGEGRDVRVYADGLGGECGRLLRRR